MNGDEEITEPDQTDVFNQSTINYSKIIRPTSMRSTYWTYFGFPADEYGSIITRRSVICSICGSALSYNKNTSNLKSHLQSKHSEQVNLPCTSPSTKKPKFYYSDDGTNINVRPQTNEHQTEVNNTEEMIEILAEEVDCDEFPDVNDYQIEYLTTDDLQNFDDEQEVRLEAKVSMKRKPSVHNNNSNIISKTTMTSSIVTMIIEDLLPTSIAERFGFNNFLTTMCGSDVQIPDKKGIEKCIQRIYKTEYDRFLENLTMNLKEKFFSIGLEKWTNCEESTFLTTVLTYVEDDEHLNTVLLSIVEINYSTDWNTHFNMLKMANCSAVIVDFDINTDESLKTFLEKYNIAIIPCFITTISKAATKCFDNITVQELFAKGMNLFNETNQFVAYSADPPKINKNFWLTKMNLIEFIYDFLLNNNERIESDSSQIVNDIKTIIDCLTPLKLTLETISMEQQPLSSLIQPLTYQLLNTHFSLTHNESQLEKELNLIIRRELEDSQAYASCFLMQSTFMDPRFQNFQSSDDITAIRRIFKDLSSSDSEVVNSFVLKKEKQETTRQAITQKQKSSGLKFFFGNKDQKSTQTKNIDRFDMEFSNYNANADANLDQLVLLWWKDSALLYPTLKKLANRFNCVLLSVQKFDGHLQKQIDFHGRRAMCTGSLIDRILWIHQNRNRLQ